MTGTTLLSFPEDPSESRGIQEDPGKIQGNPGKIQGDPGESRGFPDRGKIRPDFGAQDQETLADKPQCLRM
jgi:hypothetical protein